MRTITFDAMAGDTIDAACFDAVSMAKQHNARVTFKFNAQAIVALPDSDHKELARAYMAECNRLVEEWEKSDECKRQKEQAAIRQREKTEALRVALDDSPGRMSLKDADGWDKACAINADPYGGAVMRYAETWARLMEGGINRGEKLESIAEKMSHLADDEGITGFMYGCAVSTLAQVWAHGEELRRWHNVSSQLGDEGNKANDTGGVLNPALLTIGAP